MAAAGYVEPWRQLADRAIGCVTSAVRETNWGQPTFGPDADEELRIAYNALLAQGMSPGTAESEEVRRLREMALRISNELTAPMPNFGLAGDPHTTKCAHAFKAGIFDRVQPLAKEMQALSPTPKDGK